MNTFETATIIEKVILVGIENDDNEMSIENSLDELALLTETSGAIVVGRLIQKREAIHPRHYIGKGKLEELKDLISLHNATGIICDDELSGSQLKNMESVLETKIMDRTMLILDIFAKHANSAEGKVQVELAQLNYRSSHLIGLGVSLSRLGGGIGTRGPGEKKLETDRRHIRNRISDLNDELKEIEVHRRVLREKREKNNMFVVSIVGYTNAGKSTLMNLVSGSDVLAENKLFATLDTATRRLKLESGVEILITDTVGFIQKLPHHLIKAFRATLEELKYADILIHVVDSSNENREEQMAVVYNTLKELGCLDKPVITVFNKTDLDVSQPLPKDTIAAETLKVSAKTGNGIPLLLNAVERQLEALRKKTKVLIPFSQGSLLNLIYGNAQIVSEEHTEEGTLIEAYLDNALYEKLKPYIK